MEQPEMHSIAVVLMIEAQVSATGLMHIDKAKLLAKERLVEAVGVSLDSTPDITWGDVSCLSFVVDDNVFEVED